MEHDDQIYVYEMLRLFQNIVAASAVLRTANVCWVARGNLTAHVAMHPSAHKSTGDTVTRIRTFIVTYVCWKQKPAKLIELSRSLTQVTVVCILRENLLHSRVIFLDDFSTITTVDGPDWLLVIIILNMNLISNLFQNPMLIFKEIF